ncbi:MAG: YggS family pyridoxal phosphate-dependent enzyme [Pseudomonadota bacterium]
MGDVREQAEGSEKTKPNVADNLRAVRERITQACEQCGRNTDDVTLIAVSKSQPLTRIAAALEAGQRVFGENYVQEAGSRWPDLRRRYPDAEVHMIGGLQTNKAKDAVALFDVIQSVDRPRLAAAIAKEIASSGKPVNIFVQVNTGEEEQKAGVWPEAADDFITLCRNDHGLNVVGLMAIPPADEDIALHTALLAKIAARNGLSGLSVGMSADYETAVTFGATHVRVGSAIFGPRPPKS